TFNRQVVTVPLGDGEDGRDSGVARIARQEVAREIKSIARGRVDVDIQGDNRAVVYVEEDDISTVIGKGGGRISQVEDRLGIDIDVRTFDERPGGAGSGGGGGDGGDSSSGPAGAGQIVQPEVESRHVVVPLDGHDGETVEIQADGEYLFTATVGRGGEIRVSRGSAIAEELERAIDRRQTITVEPA
ncbi:MAG: ATPase, partial [Halobacteriales archaeon]